MQHRLAGGFNVKMAQSRASEHRFRVRMASTPAFCNVGNFGSADRNGLSRIIGRPSEPRRPPAIRSPSRGRSDELRNLRVGCANLVGSARVAIG